MSHSAFRFTFAVFLMLGCVPTPDTGVDCGEPAMVCKPGEPKTCSCEGTTSPGLAYCQPDGSGWQACRCDAGPQKLCTPNEEIMKLLCAGSTCGAKPDGCGGIHFCAPTTKPGCFDVAGVICSSTPQSSGTCLLPGEHRSLPEYDALCEPGERALMFNNAAVKHRGFNPEHCQEGTGLCHEVAVDDTGPMFFGYAPLCCSPCVPYTAPEACP